MGLSMRNGVRLVAEQINRAGGLLGRPIELVEIDDSADPERGVRVARQLTTGPERVVAVLGLVNTGVALAASGVYQQARTPTLINVATGSLLSKQFMPPRHQENYIFRLAASDVIQAEMMVREAVDRLGFSRLAIFHDHTNYGQLGREDAERALRQRGLQAVAIEKYRVGDLDMSAQLARAKRAGAQALLTYGIGPDIAQIVVGTVKLDWRVPLIGSWTLSMSSFMDEAGPLAEGARMPQTFIESGDTPAREAFVREWRKTHVGNRMPSPPAAAQGHDSLLILAAAIRQAGSLEGPRIRLALETLKAEVPGVITTYRIPFTPDDHEAITANMAVMGIVRNGRVDFAHDSDRDSSLRYKTPATHRPAAADLRPR